MFRTSRHYVKLNLEPQRKILSCSCNTGQRLTSFLGDLITRVRGYLRGVEWTTGDGRIPFGTGCGPGGVGLQGLDQRQLAGPSMVVTRSCWACWSIESLVHRSIG